MRARSLSETEGKSSTLRTLHWASLGGVALAAITLASCSTAAGIKGKPLTEGLTLYESLEPLTGKFLFLVDTNRSSFGKRRPGETAEIYECSLTNYAVRKVRGAPNGLFVSSTQGDTFAVVWAEQNPADHTYDIKAWGYSEHTRTARTATLYSDGNSYMPGSTVVVGESAFFDVWSRSGGGPGILQFNFRTGEKQFLQLPRLSDRAGIHAAEDGVNTLHVRCGLESWYGYDLLSGRVAPVNCTEERHEFRCANGRYVFFEGSEAPINGFILVSSPADSFHTKLGEADRKSVQVLKRFSRLSGGYYSLNALSPCRRYALVCHNAPIRDGWVRTYYAVNVATGKLWLLMKDEVSRKTGGSVSWVWCKGVSPE